MATTAMNPSLRTRGIQGGKLRPIAAPFSFLDYATFFVGLFTGFKLEVGGEFPYGELLLFAIFPFLLRKHSKRIFRAGNGPLLILLGLWLFSQILSDLVNGSPADRATKGIARVVVFAIDLAGLSMLIFTSRRRIKALTLGLAFSEAISYWHHSYGISIDWKYGGSFALTLVALLPASYFYIRRRYVPYVLIMGVFAVLNFHFGFRSAMATDFVVLVFTLPLFPGLQKAAKPGQLNLTRSAVLFVCCFGTLMLCEKIITYAAQNGYFTEDLTLKFEQQSSGKLGVLIGGRPEIPVDLVAIADRPILGHGSYAVDPKYIVLLQKYQFEYGYSDSDIGEDPLFYGIPSHSHLLEIWVEAGVLGALFWFYALWLTLVAIVKVSNDRPPLSPLYIFLFASFFWDILLSPFGSIFRLRAAFFLVIIVGLLGKSELPSAIRRSFRIRKPKKRIKKIRRPPPGRIAFPGLPKPDTGR